MAFPTNYSTFTPFPSGTTSQAIDDHAGRHTTEGGAISSLERIVGLSQGSAILEDFSTGQRAVRMSATGGTLQHSINGTINNSVIGTSLINGGTVGTATMTGGTINTSVAIKTPYARLTSGSAIPTTTGSVTTLSFDTERYDTDNLHAAGTPTRLTCNTAGLYDIKFNGGFASNATGFRTAYLQLNGGTYIAIQTFPAVNGDATLFALSTEYVLAANDYVEVQVLQNSGGTLNITQAANYSPEFMMSRKGPGTATA
jgi:hypothetical protein